MKSCLEPVRNSSHRSVLPGQIRRDTLYDLTGELVSQQYFGPVTDPDTSTTEVLPWLGWSIEADAAGRIVHEWNPDGAAHTGQLDGPAAVKADLTYTYDPAGRLTKVTDHTDASCTLRTYTFDQRGNRTSQGTATSTDGTCPTAVSSSVTRAYDPADRPVTAADGQSTYLYDALGRQTLIPAVDTPTPTGGNITLGYHDDDTAKTITQADTTLAYTLDVAGRRATQTTTVNAATTSVVTNHYTDTSDSPGWITTLTAGATATTVFADLVGSDLSLSLITDTTGQRGELALTTPRGDIAATTTLTTSGSAASGLDSYTRYTEYGQPDTPQPTATTGAAANGYGWLGAKQRTTTLVGILLMGARLYNTATGLFTSIDPIYGGNDTPYTYPNDPINKQDTTGKKGLATWVSNNRGAIATAGAIALCLVGGFLVCAGAQALAFAVRTEQTVSTKGGWRKNRRSIVGDAIVTGATLGLGGAFQFAKYGRTAFRGVKTMTSTYARFTGVGARRVKATVLPRVLPNFRAARGGYFRRATASSFMTAASGVANFGPYASRRR